MHGNYCVYRYFERWKRKIYLPPLKNLVYTMVLEDLVEDGR
jgi:hypothetical protein